MNTNEPMLVINDETTLADIIEQLDKLGLIESPQKIEPEYRWYFNSIGDVYATAPNAKEAEMYGFVGDFIVVNEEIYLDFIKYQVKNGSPVLRKDGASQRTQLEKSDSGFEVVKNNAALLLEDNETHTSTEHYDYRNS